MSKFIWFMLAFVALIAGIIVYNKVINPKDKMPKGPMGPPKELSVQGFVVQPRTLDNNIVASGSLVAYEDVELRPEVSGKVIDLNLQEGTPVSKGALLVKLFDADLQAQLKKLKAQKETAEKTAQRLKQLLAINGVGQQEYDNATTQLNAIEADMEYTQAQISKTEIRAPFNGTVGLRNISPGAFVTPTTLIATLQQINPLKIDFSIPEKYSSVINKNDVVRFTVDGFRDTFTSKIYAIEPHIDESTRSVKVRGLVNNSKADLLPGSFAKVDIGLKTVKDALMVPTQCIIPDARSKKLAVVRGGKAEFAKVETGVRNESYIQIISGVEPGDTVIATAIMYVKPGMDIKVTKLVE